MTTNVHVQPFDQLMDDSSATEAFKEAVLALSKDKDQRLILYNPGSPRVKVFRLVKKLFEDFPDFAFESLLIKGRAGCSEFVGEAVAQPGTIRFAFDWNCHWRAKQEGWTDMFGLPDQMRAARTFDYQCFRSLEQIA